MQKAREALQRVRALRNSRRLMGVNGIHQFVSGVDGDWMNEWTEVTGIFPKIESSQDRDDES